MNTVTPTETDEGYWSLLEIEPDGTFSLRAVKTADQFGYVSRWRTREQAKRAAVAAGLTVN